MHVANVQIVGKDRFPFGKRKAVCFTFDDCGWTSHRIALILKLRSIHATFFLNTKLITDTIHYRWQYRILRWMGFELGSHTRNHKPLTSLTNGDIEKELHDSRQNLIEVYGSVPAVFSYPESQSTPETDAHVLKWFLGVRYNTVIEGQQCYHIRTKTTTEEYQKLTKQFINGDFKALIIGGHGVDGSGYQPISSQNLRKWTSYLKQYKDQIWFCSFGELVMFEKIRDNVDCEIKDNSVVFNTSKIKDIMNKYPDTPCLYPINVLINGIKKSFTVDLRKQNKISL